MPDDFSAGEYRWKLASPPALRFHSSARLGPLMWRLGSSEWQAAQEPKTRWPLFVLAVSALGDAARSAPANVPARIAAKRYIYSSIAPALAGEQVFHERGDPQHEQEDDQNRGQSHTPAHAFHHVHHAVHHG